MDMNDLVETKLSKGEIIDILLDNMERDLAAQIKVLEDRRQELVASLKPADFAEFLGKGKVVVDTYYAGVKEPIALRFDVKHLSGTVKETYALIMDICTQKQELESVKYALENKAKARITLLRKFLEQNSEGKQILKALDSFRVTVQTKLLTAAKKETK